jgi:hypothetical protein
LTEAQLVSAILLRCGSLPHVRLWRSQPLACRDRKGRMLRALPVGFPDLSGITSTGRFIGLEIKTPTGRVSPDQERFGAMLVKFGALYAVVRSVEDALRVLGMP